MCVCACLYIRKYGRMCVCVCMYVCMYISSYACIYVYHVLQALGLILNVPEVIMLTFQISCINHVTMQLR
jgi:hypothetical protein